MIKTKSLKIVKIEVLDQKTKTPDLKTTEILIPKVQHPKNQFVSSKKNPIMNSTGRVYLPDLDLEVCINFDVHNSISNLIYDESNFLFYDDESDDINFSCNIVRRKTKQMLFHSALDTPKSCYKRISRFIEKYATSKGLGLNNSWHAFEHQIQVGDLIKREGEEGTDLLDVDNMFFRVVEVKKNRVLLLELPTTAERHRQFSYTHFSWINPRMDEHARMFYSNVTPLGLPLIGSDFALINMDPDCRISPEETAALLLEATAINTEYEASKIKRKEAQRKMILQIREENTKLHKLKR